MARRLPVIAWLAAIGVIGGCGSGRLPVAPVQGQVFFGGKPLTFGNVMFQPDVGPLARGLIQPDGTFQLSTYGTNDGAVIGRHRVRITCVEGRHPAADVGRDMVGRGKSLIPPKYANIASSGLRLEVEDGNEPFVFTLSD